MEHHVDNHHGNESRSGFTSFAFKRFVIAAILIVLAVWALSIAPGMIYRLKTPGPHTVTQQKRPEPEIEVHSNPVPSHPPATALATDSPSLTNSPVQASAHDAAKLPASVLMEEAKPVRKQPGPEPTKDDGRHQPSSEQTNSQAAPQAQPHGPAPGVEDPTGVAFVEAVIAPLYHELHEHFWGWRPNDIINFTDNVNNFQKGVLEVTRRSVVLLSERISRTGSTDSFNPHLEDAMNWLMVKADRYWFPAPESKYKESIKELEGYKQDLIRGQASFYTRSDNIIPLLASYEDLLGSCDENLVKIEEADGSTVSYFKADDYFFYAQGVASTMATILEAIDHDFASTLRTRHGKELLHHAIESCRQASALYPLLITNGDLDGIFANHRAHMAAPISHARFYIGQLIKTLST